MPTRLLPFPEILLHNLGCVSSQDALDNALKTLPPPVTNLRQVHNGDLYPVSVPGKGIDLMLQCVNPKASEPQQLWGLHAITVHTVLSDSANHWNGPWPNGLNPQIATAGDVVSLLAEDDDDTVLMTDGMTCFEVPGFNNRRWIVQCCFDPQTHILLTLSLIRTGQWDQPQWTPPHNRNAALFT